MLGIKRKAAAVVIGAAVMSVGSAFAVFAAIPSPDGSITGCYTTSASLLGPQQGSLRVADSAAQCRSSETALSWSQRGPQGPIGQQGPRGDVGPAGAQGPSAGLSGHQVAKDEVEIPRGELSGPTGFAICAPGKKVLTGGADGPITISQNRPSDDGTSWIVFATRSDPPPWAQPLIVHVWAICVNST